MFLNLITLVSVFFISLLGVALPFCRLFLPRFNALESLAFSIGLSLYAHFVLFWFYYISGGSFLTFKWFLVIPVVSIFIHAKFLKLLFADRLTQIASIGYGVILLYSILIMSYTGITHGGGWQADWYEHYSRAHFFYSKLPLDFEFLGLYSLSSRPPMANVLCAGFWGMTTASFANFELINTLLSSLVFFPMALLALSFSSSKRFSTIVFVVFILMVSPVFVANIVFPWTKLFTCFFVLLSVYCFRLSGDHRINYFLAFLFLAVGFLVHYSAGPYIVVLVLLYLVAEIRRCGGFSFWREIIVFGVTAMIIMAPWFAWAIATYGLKEPFSSNTSVYMTADYGLSDNISKIFWNIYNTLVPVSLREISERDELLAFAHLPIVQLRDVFYNQYQLNLLWGLGSLTLVVFLLHNFRRFMRSIYRGTFLRSFWFWWLFLTIVLGIAVVGPSDALGLAHICLQSIILLGLAKAVSLFIELGSVLRSLLIVGLAFDFLMGIYLHVSLLRFESLEKLKEGLGIDHITKPLEIGLAAGANYMAKADSNLKFLGDFFHWNEVLFWSTIVALILGVFFLGCAMQARELRNEEK